ncbi:MAG: 1-acyl-sn-glycerol-3-phosphate acyltransferase [Bacteroidetes bacterium]|nr:1-acyl-sn-glycerol-3-phosphate acyltransferase [Bacteroidota bacterium]
MRFLAKFILRLWGWKVIGGIPADLKKCVVVVAPHTSMYDFVIGRLAWYALGLKVKFLIKKEMFAFPLGPFLKWMGGIPVDRGRSTKLVDYVADLFDQYESLYITITPEGTRRLNPKWKRGFYYIALKANVPVALGFLDYNTKQGGVDKIFTPSGDFEKDFKLVEDFYRGRGAKHPEQFNLS